MTTPIPISSHAHQGGLLVEPELLDELVVGVTAAITLVVCSTVWVTAGAATVTVCSTVVVSAGVVSVVVSAHTVPPPSVPSASNASRAATQRVAARPVRLACRSRSA
jgi:hypothetical protein